MKKLSPALTLVLAFSLLLCLTASCAPGGETPTEPGEEIVIIPWEGKPTPSPIPEEPVEPVEPVGPIPEPDVEQKEIPDNEALRFTAGMGAGWNLGNTMDAPSEKAWVGVETTQAMIDEVYRAGFRTLRLPVTWHGHVDADFNIDKAWLDRVEEIVNYAFNNDMYVILNTHHDNDKEFVYPGSEYFERSALYVTRIWSQLSERFAGYGEKLIFENLNEPRLSGTQYEWWFDRNQEICVDGLDALCRLHQVFVDTVRAAGGYNETRYLMVCGLCASADTALTPLFRLPDDTVEDRLIVSVHAYTPYNFALQGPGESGSVSVFSMTEGRSINDINNFMGKLYEKYIINGIPVVIGEFGARVKDGNTRDRAEFAAYYTASARANGMPCVWWDNQSTTGNGELFGLLDRRNLTWVYPDIVNALVKYSGPAE